MSTAVYVGANIGQGVESLRGTYDRIICFEPCPEAFATLTERFGSDDGVELVEAACGQSAYRAPLHIYGEVGMCSSLGVMAGGASERYPDWDLSAGGTAYVDVVHLGDWLAILGIDRVDMLIIDAQGMDLAILDTVRPMLERGAIGKVQCEVFADGFTHYDGLPDNSKKAHRAFFSELPYGHLVAAPCDTFRDAGGTLVKACSEARLHWDEVWEYQPTMKLNIGAGSVRIPGFIPIDRQFGTEAFPLPSSVEWEGVQHDINDNSVAEIRASHVLEHFSFVEVPKVLTEWVRVLKPGGTIKIAVPDFKKITGMLDDPLWSRYLMGGQTDENDFHKSLFTEDALEEQMRTAGLVNVRHWLSDNTDTASSPCSLNLQGSKGEAKAAGAPVAPGAPGTHIDVKICCCASIPRVGFNDHWGNLVDALKPYDIPVMRFTGAYWGHGMQKMFIECCEAGVDWIMTIDYDSMITEHHLARLFETMARNPEIDALTCVQTKRQNKFPLLYRKDKAGKAEERARSDERGLIRVDSGHFGLTLVRTSSLKDLPLPWFASKPGADGTYESSDRIDDDIWFWRMWKDAGKSLYADVAVRIGHLELMVSEFDDNYEHRYLTIPDWRELYKASRGIG